MKSGVKIVAAVCPRRMESPRPEVRGTLLHRSATTALGRRLVLSRPWARHAGRSSPSPIEALQCQAVHACIHGWTPKPPKPPKEAACAVVAVITGSMDRSASLALCHHVAMHDGVAPWSTMSRQWLEVKQQCSCSGPPCCCYLGNPISTSVEAQLCSQAKVLKAYTPREIHLIHRNNPKSHPPE